MMTHIDAAQKWVHKIFDTAVKKAATMNQSTTFLSATTAVSVLVAYLCTVRYKRYKNLQLIREKYPDPEVVLHDSKAAHFIYNLVTAKEFPYLSRLSLELALFKTFTVPSISKILNGTGEFNRDKVVRRAEDTDLLLDELTEIYGRVQNQLKKNPNTPKEDIEAQQQRSVDSIKRLNELHGKYPILNEDFLYTLTLFIFEPISWINRFEWRQLDQREINAIFKVWCDIGRDMNIEGIPDTVDELLKFKEEYGSNHIKYHPANWKVGEPTVRLLLTQLPSFLRDPVYPTALRVLPSVLPHNDVEAFRLPYKESPFITKMVHASLRLRANFIRYFLLPRNSFYVRTPFYPNSEGKYVPNHFNYAPSPYIVGYKIEEFGPVKFLNKKNNKSQEHPPLHGDLSDIMPSRCPMMH